MSRECRNMPELHKAVMEFLTEVQQIHAAGTGRIALAALASLFTTDIPPEETTELKERGDIVLTKQDETGGSFENVGTPLKIKVSSVSLTVPQRVSGKYLSSGDAVSLMFEANETVTGQLLFFSAKLEDVRADIHTLSVDVSGDAFDQCIIHG